MKKQYMLGVMLAIGIMSARAQTSSTTIEYNKTMQSALVLELPNTTDDVEGTILEKLKQTGYNPESKGHLFWKKNKTDGFYVFNGVKLPSVSNLTLDIFFKVVQKNNQEKNNSTLYMMVSNGNGNFVTPATDSTLWNSAMAFLNGFVDKTTAYSLEQDILYQENLVKDSQKKLASLQGDEKDLNEKIKKYQDNLQTNQGNQKDLQVVIEAQNKQLADLRLRRKP